MIGLVSINKNKLEVFKKIQSLIANLIETEFKGFNEALNTNCQLLEELGFTNSKVNVFLKEVREQGGFCKISGAGGFGDEGSGLALVKTQAKKNLQLLVKKYNFTILNYEKSNCDSSR